jgi:predicted RNA polymerase sigma factor
VTMAAGKLSLSSRHAVQVPQLLGLLLPAHHAVCAVLALQQQQVPRSQARVSQHGTG